MHLNFMEILAAFMVLFAVIEILGSIPVILDLKLKTGAIVPIAFPLIAGAGSITTLLSLRAEYHSINILVALSLNMIIVYLVLRLTSLFERLPGPNGVHILRKFFGIILLAIAIKLFIANRGIEISK